MWSFHSIRKTSALLLLIVCLSVVRARGQAQPDAAQATTGSAPSKQRRRGRFPEAGKDTEKIPLKATETMILNRTSGATSSDARPKEDWNVSGPPT